MRRLLEKAHARLGDFWWYSLMLFCACRLADVLNAFVGLWLVPKYVGPSELGAVMPLSTFAGFLAIPIGVFANTFRNELSTLAINRKFGQMKSLMRGVFVASVLFLVLAIVICRFALPSFLSRIRVNAGSLGVLILLASFIGAIAPIYSNALQALKKFKANSLINFICAPVRLVTMLVAMPYRAISGYFVGQASTPAASMIISVIGLRKELSVPAEPYWNTNVLRRFSGLFLAFGVMAVASGVGALVESTVLRQRLPELDSAAYYMVTRFSEIATYLSSVFCFTIFPFTAENAARGKDPRPLIIKTSLAVLATNALLAASYGLFGTAILSLLPNGSEYSAYSWAMPWTVGIVSISCINNLYTTGEVSASRFGFLKWSAPIDILYAIALLLVTGHGYFSGLIPKSASEFLTSHNITTLSTMLWWMSAPNLLRLVFIARDLARRKPS